MDWLRNGADELEGRRGGKVAGGKKPPANEKDLAEALFALSGALDESNGAGWILTLVEGMRAEWGCTLKEAVFEESLTAALVLWPALMSRHGAEVSCNHVDRARQQAKAAKRAEIAENYIVVPTPARDRLAMMRKGRVGSA